MHHLTCSKCIARSERVRALLTLPERVGISNQLSRGEAVERELSTLWSASFECEGEELERYFISIEAEWDALEAAGTHKRVWDYEEREMVLITL